MPMPGWRSRRCCCSQAQASSAGVLCGIGSPSDDRVAKAGWSAADGGSHRPAAAFSLLSPRCSVPSVTDKLDLKKLDSYRAKAGEFRILDVPPLQYLMVDGTGDPNTEVFTHA